MANSFETEFLTPRAKKTFIYLQKTFTKATIFYCFKPKHFIDIKTDTFSFAIDRIFGQLNLNQSLFGHISHELPNSSQPISKIG